MGYGTNVKDTDCMTQTVKQALTSKQKSKWERAMEAEMNSLMDNDVWEVVPLSERKWVF